MRLTIPLGNSFVNANLHSHKNPMNAIAKNGFNRMAISSASCSMREF